MTDFSHLGALEVSTDKTAKYQLHQITVGGKSPTLILAPATQANKPYFNALLKRAGKSARQVRAGRMNVGMLEENRAEDRELYPKYVLKGWDDMADAKGKAVVFSTDEASQFLTALPDWVFDEVRAFCDNPSNFAEVVDVEVNSKN